MTDGESKPARLLLVKWKLLQHAYRDERLKPAAIGVLAVVLDHVNSKLGSAWPSLNTIAKITRSDRATVKRSIRLLIELGYLTKAAGEHRSTTYRIGSLGRLGAPISSSSDGRVQALSMGAHKHPDMGADTRPESIDLNLLNESVDTKEVLQTTRKSNPTETKRRRKGFTFREWMDSIPGENALAEDDASFKYAEKVDLSDDLFQLAWFEFCKRNMTNEIRRADWPATFKTFIRFNHGRIWYVHGGSYFLTTSGEQLKKEYEKESGERLEIPARRFSE